MSRAVFAIKLDEFEQEPSLGSAPAAQRKSDRACDFCRRRKTRCDGAPTPNSKCTNCRRNHCPCTYLEASRPRGPPKAYVTALEDRIERFERLFKRLRPDADFMDVLGPPIPRGSWKSDRESTPGSLKDVDLASSSQQPSVNKPVHVPSSTPILPRTVQDQNQLSDDDSLSSDEEFGFAEWPRRCLPVRGASHPPDSPSEDSPRQESFGTNEKGSSIRFHGKSSFFPLVQATRHYMRATAGDDGFHDVGKGSEAALSDACRFGICNVPKRRREIYWTLPPWEEAWERKHSPFTSSPSSTSASDKQSAQVHAFPSSDLTLPLLALYFHHTNTIFPLLHAPTFYAQFRDGLHLRDAQFAGVVWCLMAIGARWSQDRRVLWDGWGAAQDAALPEGGNASEDDVEWASAGWRFFLRSLDGPSFTVPSLDPPSLFDLQFCSLGAMFLRGSSIHPAGWIAIGTGLRKAMDVGAHRKKVYTPNPSVESELWKRAFCMLVLFDRIGSASLGRPCCIREEDFDLDLPLEVDDEHWIPSDPSQPAFKQPEGKPSVVSGFVSMLRLTQIMAHALRTIYCIDKSKVLLGLVSDGWQERIVSQLNTALDEWIESVPEHLRRSPSIEDDIFSNQSATIYTTYYLTLILIYRPFSQVSEYLPQQDVPAKLSKPFPFPADSICANAAHSAIRIIDAQTRRGLSNIPNMISVAQMCAVTQLMRLHSAAVARENDTATRARKHERIMQDVEKCIRCLELAQSRWIMARKFLSSFCASLPDADSNLGFKGYASRQHVIPLETPPIQVGSSMLSQYPMNDSEQALTNRANWRWFHENPTFAQRRISKCHLGPDSVRHHIPRLVPSSRPHLGAHDARTSASSTRTVPGVAPELIGMDDFSRRTDIGRRISHSNIAPLPLVVPDEPISSTSRAVRASTSGQFLSVATPQSAARDEFLVWNAQAAVRVPQHPYASLHQTSLHVYRPTADKHHSMRGNADYTPHDGYNSMT